MEKSLHDIAGTEEYRSAVIERMDIIIALLEYTIGISVEGEELEVEYGEENTTATFTTTTLQDSL